MFRNPFSSASSRTSSPGEEDSSSITWIFLQFLQVRFDWLLIGTCSGIPSVLCQLQNLLTWGGGQDAAHYEHFLHSYKSDLTDYLLEHVQESLLSSASSRTSSPGEEDSSCIPWVFSPFHTSQIWLIAYWNMFRSPFCPRPAPEPPHLGSRTGCSIPWIFPLIPTSQIWLIAYWNMFRSPFCPRQLQNLLTWRGGQ